MFESLLSILKLVFGDGLSGLGNLQKLKGDQKKALFWSLLHLYESLERLERNVSEIEEYVDDFIRWAETSEQHTLQNYTSSVLSIYFKSYTILQELLKSWDRTRAGIQSYLRIRDPELHAKLERLFGLKGSFMSFLDELARVYKERGINLAQGYAKFHESTGLFRDQAVKSIPYITEAAYSLDRRVDSWRDWVVPAEFAVQVCEIDNLKHLAVYRAHLLELRATYSQVRSALRSVITEHFTIEEMF